MLNESIKKLSKYSSNIFKLYFTTTLKTLFNLNFSLQKNISVIAPKVIVSNGKQPIA